MKLLPDFSKPIRSAVTSALTSFAALPSSQPEPADTSKADAGEVFGSMKADSQSKEVEAVQPPPPLPRLPAVPSLIRAAMLAS